jgi:NitT/TauT family transport system substrate-binding protein
MVSKTVFVVSIIVAVIVTASVTSAVFITVLAPKTTSQVVTVNRYVGGLTDDEAPVYAAVAEGFYLQNHISLNQIILSGTSAAVTAVASDRSGNAFALGDILDITVLTAENSSFPQLIETGSTGIVNPIAVMTLASSHITKPTDLIGKKVGVPFGSLSYKEFIPFLTKNGVNPSQVTIENIGFDTIDQALFSHQIDADVHFYAASIATEAQSFGEQLSVMFISQYGVPPIGSGVTMQASLVKNNPTLAREITNATLWGYWFCIKNPDQCAQDFVKENPNYNFTSVDADWKSALYDEIGYNATTIDGWNALQFGYINGTEVSNIVQLTAQLYNLTSTPNPTTLYTNQFTQPPP